MEWEHIDNFHQRARVHGGWLVKAFEDVYHEGGINGATTGWDFCISMAFVPDPKHEWIIEGEVK